MSGARVSSSSKAILNMAIFTDLANQSSFERISLTEGVAITAALYLLYLVGLAALGNPKSQLMTDQY